VQERVPEEWKDEAMLRLKGCPRCHGDLVVVLRMDERAGDCLQCGYTRTWPAVDTRSHNTRVLPAIKPVPARLRATPSPRAA